MRGLYRSLWSAGVITLAMAGEAGAATAPDSRAAGSQIAGEACGPEAARDASVQFPEPGRAQVLCGSVERVANHPVRQRRECVPQQRLWTCRPTGKEVALEVNGRQVTAGLPAAVNSWSAWQMLQAIAPMTVPLATTGPGGKQDRCELWGDDSDVQVARMTLRCQVWTVEFVRLCSAGNCRFEPAARLGTGKQAIR